MHKTSEKKTFNSVSLVHDQRVLFVELQIIRRVGAKKQVFVALHQTKKNHTLSLVQPLDGLQNRARTLNGQNHFLLLLLLMLLFYQERIGKRKTHLRKSIA